MFGALAFGLILLSLLFYLRDSKKSQGCLKSTIPSAKSSHKTTQVTRHITPLYQPDSSRLLKNDYCGEAYVSLNLHRLNKSHYIVLDNLLLPSRGPRFKTAQIDHVVVSNYGIFVIETKSHTGYILGSFKSKDWTQCKPRHERHKIHNPVTQNYGHLQVIKNILGFWDNNSVHSVCIFPNAAKLIIDDCQNVFGLNDAMQFISGHTMPMYTNDEVNHMVETLLRANITDIISRQNHNTQLQLQYAT